MIKLKYPGKLFLLGEYAIMEKGNSAVIVAVNRYLHAQIQASNTLCIQSDYGELTQVNFSKHKELKYVETAYLVAKDYLKLKGIKIQSFELILTSELSNQQNQKYGFGSSGVVIVAVLDAILKHHKISLDSLRLFKLSVVCQMRMNKLSSGGDLASSIYGGLIKYTRYDPRVITNEVDCVEVEWPNLRIEKLENKYHIEVAWTQKSHDTNVALARFLELKKQKPALYQQLIKQANTIVVDAIEKDDLIQGIDLYRHWMNHLATVLDYEIETPELTSLIDIAHDLGYHAKVSGSGGGDCGFAISEIRKDQNEIKKAWEHAGLDYIEKGVL